MRVLSALSGHLVSGTLARRLPFFYGYVMAPVAMMMQVCTSPGQTFAVSAFTPSLRESLAISDSRLSLAYMLGTFLAAFPLSLVGPLADRWGLRRVATAALLGLIATCLLASQIRGFATLFVAFLLLRFLGQGSLTLLSGNTVSMWFRGKIGRVSAVMSIGSAVAFAWVPQWLTDAIEAYGWRQTYVGIAGLIAGVMLPMLWLLFRNRPEDLGQRVDGERLPATGPQHVDVARDDGRALAAERERSWCPGEAYRSAAFLIPALVSAVWAMTGTAVVFYLFTLCEDRGLSPQTPPDVLKVFGLAMLAAQLGAGVLADYLRLNWLMGAGATLLAIGMAIVTVADSRLQFFLFAAFFGAGQGALIAVNAVLYVRYFGRAHLGSIRGTVWCLTVAGSGGGPFLMGMVRDATGKFDGALWVLAGLLIPLALLAWFASDPGPSVEEG